MKKLMTTAAIAAASLLSMPAFAGYKQNGSVYIDTVNKTASGSLADARQDGGNAFVSTNSYATTTYVYAQVQFRNAADQYASCWTQNRDLYAVIQSAKGDSYVVASWDASGQCTYVNVFNSSYFAPKAP